MGNYLSGRIRDYDDEEGTQSRLNRAVSLRVLSHVVRNPVGSPRQVARPEHLWIVRNYGLALGTYYLYLTRGFGAVGGRFVVGRAISLPTLNVEERNLVFENRIAIYRGNLKFDTLCCIFFFSLELRYPYHIQR